jgi:hypothetical protein
MQPKAQGAQVRWTRQQEQEPLASPQALASLVARSAQQRVPPQQTLRPREQELVPREQPQAWESRVSPKRKPAQLRVH